uniref:Putative secreted protein n=1 Tax=Ixodes ricinus TaxID=34613 RepID=A0A6B0UIY8_IXORI
MFNFLFFFFFFLVFSQKCTKLRFTLQWATVDTTSQSSTTYRCDYAPRACLRPSRRSRDTPTAPERLRWLVASSAVRRKAIQIIVDGFVLLFKLRPWKNLNPYASKHEKL